jgi:hypothetical protein
MLVQACEFARDDAHADGFTVDELREVIIHKNRGDRRAEFTAIALERLGVIEPTSIEGRYRIAESATTAGGDQATGPHDIDSLFDPERIAAKKQRDLERLLQMVRLIQERADIAGFLRAYFAL